MLAFSGNSQEGMGGERLGGQGVEAEGIRGERHVIQNIARCGRTLAFPLSKMG